MKRFTLFAVLALMLLAFGMVATAQRPQLPQGAPTHIIVFNDNAAFGTSNPGLGRAQEVANEMAAVHGLNVTHVYGNAIHGFAAVVPAGRLRALQNDPRVAYVEENAIMTISAQSIPTGVSRIFATSNSLLGIDSTDYYS